MARFPKAEENLYSSKSCDVKVKLATAIYLKALKEGEDKISSLLMHAAPAEIADEIAHLPFKANLYTRSAVLIFLEAITPPSTKPSNSTLTQADIRRNEAFHTVFTHFFRHTDVQNLKPAIGAIKAIGQPELLVNDLLLQNPHVFLEELSFLLNHVFDMKASDKPDCNFDQKAKAAGWQAATLFGNAFQYVQEAANRIEVSQNRIARYIGEAVTVLEAVTGTAAESLPYSAAIGELSKDMMEHIGKAFEIKSVSLNPSLDLTKLVRTLAEASDLVKSQAKAGIIAPGKKFISADHIGKFASSESLERKEYITLGSAFNEAYSQHLKEFAKHYLEHETSKSVDPVK